MGTGITLNVIITRKLITNFFVLLHYTIINNNFQVLFYILCNFFILFKHTQKYIDEFLGRFSLSIDSSFKLWLSPRFISIGQLNALLHLHLQPINQLVFLVSYQLNVVGYLILGWASHLDAFSVYPFHT